MSGADRLQADPPGAPGRDDRHELYRVDRLRCSDVFPEAQCPERVRVRARSDGRHGVREHERQPCPIPEFEAGPRSDQRPDDAGGGRQVLQCEDRPVFFPRADDGDPVPFRQPSCSGRRIERARGCSRAPRRSGAEGKRAVRGEEHDLPAGDRMAPDLGRAVPHVKPGRRQPTNLPGQQRAPFLRDCPRPGFALSRDDGPGPMMKQQNRRRRRPECIDHCVCIGGRPPVRRRQEQDVKLRNHQANYRAWVGTRTSNLPVVPLPPMDARPVGMFDSGVGGLAVLRSFRELAPAERVLYFADTAWFPYGPRPAAEVRKRAFAITHRLLESDVKLIVVACNTASAAALADLREAFPAVPFVGMVPGVKPAARRSQSRRVVVLATPGTLDGELLQRVVDEFGRGTQVARVAGHGLAEAVEQGVHTSPAVRARLRELLGPEIAAGADTVVLGCTHYTFLGPVIAGEFPGVTLIDTSEPVARRAVDLLREMDALGPGPGGIDLIVSQDPAEFRRRMARLGFSPAPEEAVP